MNTNGKNNDVNWKTIFGVAAVWFGSHVGGGFATGNQTRTFFAIAGFPAVFLPFVSVLIIAWVFYEGLQFARNTNEYNYHNWIVKLFEPYGKPMGYVFDIAFFLLALVGTGASIAGGAKLMESLFGLPYIIGVLITGSIFFLLTIFGAELVRNSSAVITLILLVVLSLIILVGLGSKPQGFIDIVSSGHVNTSWTLALWNALRYAGFQSLVLAIMLGSGKPLTTSKSVTRFAVLGIILNGVMITLSCWMLLAHLPIIANETLPILAILESLNVPAVKYAYSVSLFLAFVSTGVGCVFGVVARYEDNILKQMDVSKRRMLLSFFTMALSTGISLVGLDTLVLKGYGYLGVITIVFLIIPTIVIGTIKNRKFNKG